MKDITNWLMVKDFWTWFDSVSESLYLDLINEEILGELNIRVSQLGPFEWEIGPADQNCLFLAISPNLAPDLLETTAQIVAEAIPNKHWIFLPSKPRKDYEATWEMRREGQNLEINTSLWEYVLYRFPDGTFDMDLSIEGTSIATPSSDLAIDIALTNILGEETFMRLIQNINVVADFEEDVKPSSFRYLNDHIMRILENA